MGKTKQSRTKQNKKPVQKKTIHKEVPIKFLMHHLNSPISIYDSRNSRFVYANPQFCQLTGLTADEVYNLTLDGFLNIIHAKDILLMLHSIATKVREACTKYIKNKKPQLIYTLNYRFRQKDGRYVQVMVQSTVLEWDQKTQRSVALNLYTDISHHKKDHKIVLTINVFNSAERQWKTVVTEEFLSSPEMLSEREQEVMKLMVEENTASEISKLLGLKFYTVRAHWRNILSKTDCKTQKELKEMAQREGWV